VLRQQVAAIDPALPLANLKPLGDLVDASVAARRFAMLLVLLFAVVALVLSAVGLYSVLAHMVAARSEEVGVRLALGASGRDVIWLFVREGMWLTLAGLAAGLVAARASASLLASSLVGITASDPATLASVAATLAIVALAAIAVPVWRASRINPAMLLRADA
jgi:ABC-type antimicrobial peptide transport system permease subunit